ncbi:MAG: NAD(P)-dependent oxidoreductase, partial [Pseudomonadota bacterium]
DGLLMNLGRGALVDEAALVTALDAGDLAFAALDVVSEEPLPAGNVLWTHPKVMLTPHDSAMTEPTRHRQDQVFLDNLDLWLAGQPLNNVAPKSAFEPG